MSIKRLAPEAIETFSMVLHPKRRYSARANYLVNNNGVSDGVPFNALATEAGEAITTESSQIIVTES